MIVSFEVLDVATVFSSLLVEVVFEFCTPHATRRETDNRTIPRPINFFCSFHAKIPFYSSDLNFFNVARNRDPPIIARIPPTHPKNGMRLTPPETIINTDGAAPTRLSPL